MLKSVKLLLQHSVAKNTLALLLLQFANYIVPLLVLPYMTRVLGKENFGIVAVVLSMIQFSFILTDFGFSISATHKVSLMRKRKEYIALYIGSIYLIKIFLIIPAIVLIYFLSYISETYREFTILFVLGSISIVGQAYQPLWFFQGIEKMKDITIFISITKIFYAILIFITVKTHYDSWKVILSWGCANLLGAFISNLLLYKEGYYIVFPKLASIKKVMKEGLNFFLSRIAVAIYTSMSTVIVGVFSGNSEVALFSVSYQLFRAGQNVTSPLNQALYPYMTVKKDWSLFRKLIIITTLILVVFVLILMHVSPIVISFMFGEDFLLSAKSLNVLLIVIVITFISANLGYPAFAAIGLINYANKSVIVGSIFFFIVTFILVLMHNINAYTMAINILLTESMVLFIRSSKLVQFFYFKKK